MPKGKVRVIIAALALAVLMSGAAGAVGLTLKTVMFAADGAVFVSTETRAATVGEFLAEQGVELGEFDTVIPGAEYAAEDGMEIAVLRGATVTVVVDGEEWRAKTIQTKQTMLGVFVADYSAKTGVSYEFDLAGWSDLLTDGQTINLRSKRTETFDLAEPIPFGTVTIEAADVDEGTEITLVEGVDGVLTVTTKVNWVGGAETYREVVGESIAAEPVSAVIMVGTRTPGKTEDELVAEEIKAEEIRLEAERIERERQEQERIRLAEEEAARKERERIEAEKRAASDRARIAAEQALLSKEKAAEVANLNYRQEVVMTATAYTADYASTGKSPGDPGFGITASGRKAQVGVVAVDPRVIPLGTELFVEGYGYAIAGDTGGAIKGNKIDLFFDTAWEVKMYGRQLVRVYILN